MEGLLVEGAPVHGHHGAMGVVEGSIDAKPTTHSSLCHQVHRASRRHCLPRSLFAQLRIMRVSAIVGAVVLAVAATAVAQDNVPVEDSGGFTIIWGSEMNDIVSGGEAPPLNDADTAAPDDDGTSAITGVNASDPTASLLMAAGTNGMRFCPASINVRVVLSSCFSGILNLKNAISAYDFGSYYSGGTKIGVQLSFAFYKEGRCTLDTNAAGLTQVSVFTPDDLSVCQSASCNSNAKNAPTPNELGRIISAIKQQLYCRNSPPNVMPVPFTSTTDGCVCGCDSPFEMQSGVCKCPAGQVYAGDTCKPAQCFWKPNGDGYICNWSDQTSTPRTLGGYCAVPAPQASDVYVEDSRKNAYDDTTYAAGLRPDPMIKMWAGTAESTAPQATWNDYELTPLTLENQITFSDFGVYDLSMVATDYRGSAKCTGCVAVVDTYPPTPAANSQCTTTDRLVTADYSKRHLDAAKAAEQSFINFYSNAVDNGPSTVSPLRADTKSLLRSDFFEAALTDQSTQFESTCFNDNFVTDLLDKVTKTDAFKDYTSNTCARTCKKNTQLGGSYVDYKCGKTTFDTVAFPSRDSDKCAFSRTLTMQPSTLASADVDITDAAEDKSREVRRNAGATGFPQLRTLYRSIDCEQFSTTDSKCWFTAKLSDFFEKEQKWELSGIPASYKVGDYVQWYYSVNGQVAQRWDDSDLVFKEGSSIKITAYTPCGRIREEKFYLELYPLNGHTTCENFKSKWSAVLPKLYQRPTYIASGAWCAYPDSDFAVVTFDFDGSDVKYLQTPGKNILGKYVDAKCTIKVDNEGADFANVASVDMDLAKSTSARGKFTVSDQFAVELVHNPATSINTKAQVHCEFSFQYNGKAAPEPAESCNTEFSITDCVPPKINDAVCTNAACFGPDNTAKNPGLHEACGGKVYTTSQAGTTAVKAVQQSCCTECTPALTLQCATLSEASHVQRCESASKPLVLALAETAEEGAHDAGTAAVVGMGAVVAVIALVAIKRRMAKTAHENAADDVYYPLLE